MIRSESRAPSASSRVQPNIWVAVGFQKVTLPVAAMPITASSAPSSTARMCAAVSRLRSFLGSVTITASRSSGLRAASAGGVLPEADLLRHRGVQAAQLAQEHLHVHLAVAEELVDLPRELADHLGPVGGLAV